MSDRRLSPEQTAEFQAFIASHRKGRRPLSEAKIAKLWNAQQTEQSSTVSPMTVHSHKAKVVRAYLASADADTKEVTDAIVGQLIEKAMADPRDLVRWEGSRATITDSSKLTVAQASMLQITVRGKRDEQTLELNFDPRVQILAAKTLLDFFHGSKVRISTGGPDLVARLSEAGDRDGLMMLQNNKDPAEVLSLRASHLAIFDLLKASDDAEGLERLRNGENAIAVLKDRASSLKTTGDVIDHGGD